MRQFFDQTETGGVLPKPFRYCPYCGAELGKSTPASCEACQYVKYDNPLPAVSVLIRDKQGRVLVGRRRATPDLWCLPCGFIESNENFLEAAHRETREETGLSIRIRSVVNVVSNLITPQLESLVVVLLAEIASGELAPGDDLVELRWITDQDVPPLAFSADRFLIGEYFRTGLAEIEADPRFILSPKRSRRE
jgi:8-oxo-dGTP diphosphatase